MISVFVNIGCRFGVWYKCTTEHGVVKSELLEKEYEWSTKMGTKSTKLSWGDADPDKSELDAVE